MVLNNFFRQAVPTAKPQIDTTPLLLSALRRDGGTQSRSELDAAHIERLREARSMGATLPPVKVYHDGSNYWLVDGFHRVKAAELDGAPTILAEVQQGDQRAAILASCGANHDHGLPRSTADKRRAVALMLSDGEWGAWSDREIARQCNVSHTFVSKMRETTGNVASENRTFVDRHGNVSKMNVANIGNGKIEVQPSVSEPEEVPMQPDLVEGPQTDPVVEAQPEPAPITESQPEPTYEPQPETVDWDAQAYLADILQELAYKLKPSTAEKLYDALQFIGDDVIEDIAATWIAGVEMYKGDGI